MSEKLNKIIICCLLVTLVGAGVLYVVESDKRLRYEAMLDGLYNKSFFDMTSLITMLI